MKSVLPLSVVALAAALAGLTWYVALMPLWLTQSGERTSSGGDAYYAQGVGIWLNYTEHVGDATFDPGNSLWVPIQPTGADSFASQCSVGRPFCSNAVGELHKQYCQVMQVYCGAAMAFLQVAMSALSGLSILAIVWAVRVVTTAHRTAADRYLMHLCVLVGVSYLVIVVVWYIGVFRVILDTTFYKDQYSRCSENSTGRKCWSVGLCVYLSIAGAVLYPLLSVLAVTHITNKFRRFQRLLRKLFESVTLVELPPAAMALKTESVNADAAKAGEVAIQVDKRLGALSPTGRHPPSTLRSASDLRLDVDNATDEIDDDDHAGDSHGHPSSKMTAV